MINRCLPSTHHCSLQTSLALRDVTYVWVTWGEPLAQEISSPGKTAEAAKLPGIYCRSSITEWPYFLRNIAVPQENLSHASYTSKWVVMIQEPPKTVIRSYTIAYNDCNTKPLVSCSGTCLSHQLIDHGCSSYIGAHHRLSLKKIVLIRFETFSKMQAGQGCVVLLLFQQGCICTYPWTTKSTGSFPWKYGHSVVLERGNFRVGIIFPDKGITKNSPPFSHSFFPSSSLTSLACYLLLSLRSTSASA